MARAILNQSQFLYARGEELRSRQASDYLTVLNKQLVKENNDMKRESRRLREQFDQGSEKKEKPKQKALEGKKSQSLIFENEQLLSSIRLKNEQFKKSQESLQKLQKNLGALNEKFESHKMKMDSLDSQLMAKEDKIKRLNEILTHQVSERGLTVVLDLEKDRRQVGEVMVGTEINELIQVAKRTESQLGGGA